jgi:hypothetical protein
MRREDWIGFGMALIIIAILCWLTYRPLPKLGPDCYVMLGRLSWRCQ